MRCAAAAPGARRLRPRLHCARRVFDTPLQLGPPPDGARALALVVYPTANLYDGRGANRAWLQEVPDPLMQTVWSSWAEVARETGRRARRRGRPTRPDYRGPRRRGDHAARQPAAAAGRGGDAAGPGAHELRPLRLGRRRQRRSVARPGPGSDWRRPALAGVAGGRHAAGRRAAGAPHADHLRSARPRDSPRHDRRRACAPRRRGAG